LLSVGFWDLMIRFIISAASEILKILPCPTLECVQYAEKVNKDANKANLIKHNKAVYYRLDLANAIAYYQTKNVSFLSNKNI